MVAIGKHKCSAMLVLFAGAFAAGTSAHAGTSSRTPASTEPVRYPLRLAAALENHPSARAAPALQAMERGQLAVDPAPPQLPVWEIRAGDRTIGGTLARWAASAGWQLVWDLDIDYPIQTHAVLQGTFDEAVGEVASSLEAAPVPMQAIFYSGNRVLRVVAKGRE